MKKLGVLFGFLLLYTWASAQVLERVEPMFWWTGMKNPKLQLLVHGKDVGALQVEIKYPGVKILKVHRVENPNYLFIDLELAREIKPGKFRIDFNDHGTKKLEYNYELKPKSVDTGRVMGVNSGDLIYELMPDRFSNGDPSNDVIKGTLETSISRDSLISRHGGDIQGVINHLDYLKDLGITALWLTPEVENDQSYASYHGYAITDHYKIDPRFGNNKLYKEFVALCHSKGLKVIKDVIHNHVGDSHWFIKDLPMKNWLHQWPVYTQTNYINQTLMDPYAASDDRKQMLHGWFAQSMPDLNQENEFVQNYITQNLIWWVEYAGIDGLRIDTYPYNNLKYMAKWAAQMKAEFPRLDIFGETLVSSVVSQAYFTQGNTIGQGLDTQLPGVTDVQVKDAIYKVLNGQDKPESITSLYDVLSQDLVYKDPFKNVIFLDNHDMSRFYSMITEDLEKYKSGLALLLTTRGIPQVYYGGEILMKNFSNPDGLVRLDFPGGWASDPVNKFLPKGRTKTENEAFDYFRKLAQYRKNSSALKYGKLMQYAPEDGLYVYFRFDQKKTVMVILNSSKTVKKIRTKRFSERLKGFQMAKNIMTEEKTPLNEEITVPANITLILELM